jgi:hypothetical protein
MTLIPANMKLGPRALHAFTFGSIAACVLFACSSGDGGNDAGGPPPTTDGGSSGGGDAQNDPDSAVSPQHDASSDQNAQTDSTPGSSSGGDVTCGTFTAHGDDVTDSTTGLVWKRTILPPQNFQQAQAACPTWESGRLPTKDELVAVVPSEEKCKAALGWTDPFGNDPAWTSTPYPVGQENYYTVYFDPTLAPVSSPSPDSLPVRCVR